MKKRLKKDPFAAREAEKYDSPVASREFILNWLEAHGKPASLEEVIEQVLKDPTDDRIEALRRRLIAMSRDGQLICTRRGKFGLPQKMDLIAGRIQANKEGFGFLIPEDGSPDLFLSARQMRGLFHGDKVMARLSSAEGSKPEGTVVELLERYNDTLAGRFIDEEGLYSVTPTSKHFMQDIWISKDKTLGAKTGQIVKVKLLNTDIGKQARGEVTEILGQELDPGLEIEVASLTYKIPTEFPSDVLEETALIPEKVLAKDLKDREDLRALPLITIDGADARDFDDAVYAEKNEKGKWRLIVAIADVSHYVKPDSALDREAQNRGNSVYFPENVIPMLPEKLSNGLCSLNPEVDRLCMVCDMALDKEGKVTKYRFYRAVIHSKARTTYDEVQQMIDGKVPKKYQGIQTQIAHLYELYQLLHVLRVKRGALDFDTVETKIIFSADRKIEKIVPVVRNEAHQLIEECMLAANECTAKFLSKNKLPTLYRNHEGPKKDKLDDLRKTLSLYKITLKGGKNPSTKDYQDTITQMKKLPESRGLSYLLLRSLLQAQYHPENKGHFGLSYKEYVHFTSPIRRYPDLLVHRAIGHYIDYQKAKGFPYTLAQMIALGENCSMTERRADEATRDVMSFLKCEYMSHHINKVYHGKVSSVVAFGLFVELQEVFVEGLVHVTALKNDYYHLDASKQSLIGDRTGKKYSLGDTFKIRVLRVNQDTRQIDFELA